MTGFIAGYEDERCPLEWTEKRFDNVIKLRQQALDYARNVWSDYLFVSITWYHNKYFKFSRLMCKTPYGFLKNNYNFFY